MIFREQELLFRGSRERLKRSILRKEGALLENCRFYLLWRSRYFRRGLAFRIQGSYEKTADGFLLSYRFVPTLAAILWILIPMAFFLAFAGWELRNGNPDGAAAVALYSILYPAVALWQAAACHREFCRYFQVATK